MRGIEAVSADSLIRDMELLQIAVLGRGIGRTKIQTEDWVRRTILLSQAKSGRISYPMKAREGDRPDLDLYFSERSVGVEITELIQPDFAAADAYANRHMPDAIVDRSLFRWGRRIADAQVPELVRQTDSKLGGPGWSGDEAEHEWVTAMLSKFDEKTESINKPGYRDFSEYWLAVYENLQLPILNVALAVKMLKAGMSCLPRQTRSFSYFLIESGRNLISIDTDGRVQIDAVPGTSDRFCATSFQ